MIRLPHLHFLSKRSNPRRHSAKYNFRYEVLESRFCLSAFTLHSNPGANHTIYLDFDGHVTQGTTWNSVNNIATINSPAYDLNGDPSTFSTAELTRIQNIWEIVSEDFIPFNIDVTTEDPGTEALRYSGGGDTRWGVRVVITDDTFANCGCGGHAYIGSFDDPSDEPVFVYNTSQTGVSEAASHEVGHSLLLSHDGTSNDGGYYSGHGSGETSWGTLMGVSYNRHVTQWSQGEYYDSNNTGSSANYGNGADDLAIISSLTNGNGFDYRTDDHGDVSASATALSLSEQNINGSGIIERTTDVDVFSFMTGGGNIQLDIDTVQLGPNLDIRAELRDAEGAIVAVSNPASVLKASFDLSVPEGQYTLHVTGVGTGNPLNSSPSGYTEYGSLGRYYISGTVNESNLLVISVATSDASAAELGADPGTFTFSRSGNISDDVTVAYAIAGTAQNGVDYHPLSGSVAILAGQTSANVTVTPIDDATSEGNETVVLTIIPGASYIIGSPNTDLVTIADDDQTDIDDFPYSGSVIDGTLVSGSYLDTHSDNDVYQVIQEERYAGNKRSRMQSNWTINVTGGNSVTFFVEAHHDSNVEDFDFEYSTDGTNWTQMLTVASNTDNDVPQTYELPNSLSGDLLVRVIDTDRSRNERALDSLSIDEMFVRSTFGGDPLPQVSIIASDSNASEQGLDPGEFNITRSGDLAGDLVVYYVIGGNANNGADYGALSGSVTIADGDTSATIVINPIDDAESEGSESIVLTLQSDPAYMLTSPNSDTVTIADNDLISSNGYAISETNVYGTVSGSLYDTESSNGVYETVTEELFAGNKRSRLLHQWTFNVTGGNTVTFVVEAHHDGVADDFEFEYSTDGSAWANMLTVTKTSDDNTTQNFNLPNSTSGAVFVRVVDTTRGKDAALDTIYIDKMYISSDNFGESSQSDIEVEHQDPKWMFESVAPTQVDSDSQQQRSLNIEMDVNWSFAVDDGWVSQRVFKADSEFHERTIDSDTRNDHSRRLLVANPNSNRAVTASIKTDDALLVDQATVDWADDAGEKDQLDSVSVLVDQIFADLEDGEWGVL